MFVEVCHYVWLCSAYICICKTFVMYVATQHLDHIRIYIYIYRCMYACMHYIYICVCVCVWMRHIVTLRPSPPTHSSSFSNHSTSMCGLTLACVTSETSTSNSNADILSRSSSPWLDPLFATVSGVRCWLPLSVVPRQLFSRLSLCCPVANCSPPGPVVNYLPAPLSSQLSFASPYHFQIGEISGPRILCLVSRQNRQRNRLLWWATHIVLQYIYIDMYIYRQYEINSIGWFSIFAILK